MSRKVSVIGRLPGALGLALQEAGYVIREGEPLVIVADGRAETVQKTIAEGNLPVAVAEDGSSLVELLAAGALEVLRPPWRSSSVRRSLDPLSRVSRLWAQRGDAHQRSALKVESDLQSTQDLLSRVIDATPNPVMGADPEGRVIVYNRAAERALGYEGTWVKEHMHVSDIYADPGEARRVLNAIRKSNDGFAHELEVRLRTRTGEQVPVSLSAAEVYGPDGLIMATVGIFQDRRVEFHLRSRLEETTTQLIQSEQRAAASDAVRATAHELNQPLTTAMGSLELVGMSGPLSEKQRARLDRAYQQLERMAEVVQVMAQGPQHGGDGGPDSAQLLALPSQDGL